MAFPRARRRDRRRADGLPGTRRAARRAAAAAPRSRATRCRTGVVLDLPGTSTGSSRRPGGADGGGGARHRARLDHRGGRAARAAVRPRPVHALARAPSAARSATTPAARGRCATGAPPTTWSRSTSSPAPARGSPRAASGVTRRGRARGAGGAWRARRRALLADLRALVGGHLATIRTEFGRFTRQVSGYSLEHLLPENGTDVAKFLVRHRGHARAHAARHRPPGRRAAATALAVLGYPDMAAAAEAVPALLPHLPVALEGLDSRLVDVVRTRRGPRRRARPAARRRLAVRRDRGRHRSTEARDAATKLVADGALPRQRGDHRRPGRRAVAHPRGRRGPRRPHPGGAPAWPGWEDSRRAAGQAARPTCGSWRP